jgi:hypothetical protein
MTGPRYESISAVGNRVTLVTCRTNAGRARRVLPPDAEAFIRLANALAGVRPVGARRGVTSPINAKNAPVPVVVGATTWARAV